VYNQEKIIIKKIPRENKKNHAQEIEVHSWDLEISF